MVASHATPTGDLSCIPGMCPDWESNWWSFGSQAGTQSTEPHQPGLKQIFIFIKWGKTAIKYSLNRLPWKTIPICAQLGLCLGQPVPTHFRCVSSSFLFSGTTYFTKLDEKILIELSSMETSIYLVFAMQNFKFMNIICLLWWHRYWTMS